MFDEETQQILAASTPLWDQTEKILKMAEQLRGELVVPAVTELRYAGRKLVDFVNSRIANEDIADSKKHIYDYEQCCIRARHDAVDAVVMYMKVYYSNMVRTFGIDVISQAYHFNADLRHAISVVEQRVLISREERHKRIDLYSEINGDTLPSLVEKFQALIDSQPVIEGIREARDREHRLAVIGMWVGVIGLILAIVFGVFGIWAAFKS